MKLFGRSCTPSSLPSACLPPFDASSETTYHSLPLLAPSSARSALRRPPHTPQSYSLRAEPAPESESTPNSRCPLHVAPLRGSACPKNPQSRLPFHREPVSLPLWNGTSSGASPRSVLLPPALPCRHSHPHR